MPNPKKAPSAAGTFIAFNPEAILEVIYPGIIAVATHRVFGGQSLIDGRTNKPKDDQTIEFVKAALSLARRMARKLKVKFTLHAAEKALYLKLLPEDFPQEDTGKNSP